MCRSPITEDTVIARNMLRDLLPCADFDAMAGQIGFIPSSPDVSYDEHIQSHRRCSSIEPVSEVIARLAANAGQLAAAMTSCTEHGGVTEEAVEHYVGIAHFATFAVILQMIEHGYLAVRTR